MDILMVTRELPYPPISGNRIRTFNLIRELSKKHRIKLVSFFYPHNDTADIKMLKKFCVDIVCVPLSKKQSLLKFLKSCISNMPYKVMCYRSKIMAEKIKELVSENKFKVVHFDDYFFAQYLDDGFSAPVVMTAHNAEFMLIKRYEETRGNIIQRIYGWTQSAKLKHFEINGFAKADKVVTVSHIDRKIFLNEKKELNISVVDNGVDTEHFMIGKEQPANVLLFTGSMSRYPNVNAVVYFAEEIFPLIKAKKPFLKFVIAGRSPLRKVKQLANKDKSIIVTGRVDDIREYISKCLIYVCPLRIGGGSHLKVLEAMAMGRPVVSTSVGCEGLKIIDGRDFLRADTPIDFANMVFELLDNYDLREKIVRNARKLMEEKYDWKICADKLEAVYEEVAK
ncbi:MAG: glycosyltransferase family 4 protein [Candidatus Omnitrophica bacterium]|nr:glycosyltransferase family 4 protein [Candidatus Omnitrophota bacterium]